MSKLEEWIRVQRSKGYTLKQLEQYLIKQGYNKAEVDNICIKISSEETVPPPPKIRNNHTWIWIILVTLLFVGGGYLYYTNYMVLNDTIAIDDDSISATRSTLTTNNISNNANDLNINTIANNVTNNSSAINVSANLSSNASVNISNIIAEPICGDNKVDFGEECDGRNFENSSCQNFTAPNGNKFNGGLLKCNDCISINTSSCSYCGDGMVNTYVGEWCEEDVGFVVFKKNGKEYDWLVSDINPCKNFGYESGTVKCDLYACTWNITGCYNKVKATCGNGIIELDEECDQGIIGKANASTCQDFNATTNSAYLGGDLLCTQDCLHDFAGCIAK